MLHSAIFWGKDFISKSIANNICLENITWLYGKIRKLCFSFYRLHLYYPIYVCTAEQIRKMEFFRFLFFLYFFIIRIVFFFIGKVFLKW